MSLHGSGGLVELRFVLGDHLLDLLGGLLCGLLVELLHTKVCIVGLRTPNFNALNCCPTQFRIHCLCGVLDSFDGALASNGCGAEEADLAGELLAEHDDEVWSWRCEDGECDELSVFEGSSMVEGDVLEVVGTEL